MNFAIEDLSVRQIGSGSLSGQDGLNVVVIQTKSLKRKETCFLLWCFASYPDDICLVISTLMFGR